MAYKLVFDNNRSYETDRSYTFEVESFGDVTGLTYTITCMIPSSVNQGVFQFKKTIVENSTTTGVIKWTLSSDDFGPFITNSSTCSACFGIVTSDVKGAIIESKLSYFTLKMNPKIYPKISNVKMELTDAFQDKSLSNVTEHVISFDVAGTYGASQNITVEVDGKVYSKRIESSLCGGNETVSFDLGTLTSSRNNGESKSISVKAVDSRGNTHEADETVTVYKYEYPIPASDCHVAWGEGDDIDKPYLTFGCTFQKNVAGVANSMVSINVYLNDLTTVLVDVLGHPSPNVIPGNYDIGESYVFRVEFTDKVGTTVGYYDLMRQLVVMDTSADGNMISFFQAASNSANGTKFRIFADETQIGDNDKRHVILDSDGVKFYANTDTDSRLAASISVGYNDDGTAKLPLSSAYTFGRRKNNTIGRNFSFVVGDGNEASGYASHAGGQDSSAKGMLSYAFGRGVVSYQNYHFAIGEYNVSDENDTTGPKKLFSVGNGANNDTRSDAFVVKNSGDVVVQKDLSAATASISGAITANTVYTDNWFRSKGSTGWYSEDYGGGWYMIDDQWIRAYNNKNIVTGGLIQAGAEFSSCKTRDWRFGCATGTGDTNQFGFYDTQYGLHCTIVGSDHSFRLNGEYWCNRSEVSWAFGSVTGTGDAHLFSFYDVNTNLVPLSIAGATGDIYVGQNRSGANVGIVIGPMAAGNRAYLYSSADYPGALWIQTRYNGNWVWYSLAQACSKALSDIRLKTDIKEPEVANAMDVINTMQLHSFTRKDSHEKYRIGFIADELEQIDPTLTDGGGEVDGHPYYKSVNELQVTAYVVKALQELNNELNKVKIELSNIRRAK